MLILESANYKAVLVGYRFQVFVFLWNRDQGITLITPNPYSLTFFQDWGFMGKVFLIKIFSFGYLREVFKIILENINKTPRPPWQGET